MWLGYEVTVTVRVRVQRWGTGGSVEMGNTLRSFRGDETVPADYATKTATTGGGRCTPTMVILGRCS